MALFGKNRFTRIRSNYVASQPTSPVVAPNSQSANGLHSDDESQRRMDAPGETARLRGNRVYAAWPKSECPTPSPWSAYRSASPRSESWMGSFEQHIPAAVKHDRLDISFHPSSRHCTRPKSRVGRAEQRGSEIKERARLRDATLRPRLHWTSHPSKSRRRPNDRVGIRPAVERLPNTTTSPLGTVGTPRSRVGHVCMEDGLFGDERKLAQHQCRRCGSCTAAESPALVMGLKRTVHKDPSCAAEAPSMVRDTPTCPGHISRLDELVSISIYGGGLSSSFRTCSRIRAPLRRRRPEIGPGIVSADGWRTATGADRWEGLEGS